MTGLELKTFTEGLIDDTIEDTLFYQLLNVAKDNVEGSKDWMYLKKEDSSSTSNSGDTYLTMQNLASDFRKVLKVFVGTDSWEHFGVPFEERIKYKDSQGKFYLDIANSQYAIIGAPASSKTIYMYYIYQTDDITSTTSPVFPSRFHPILGYMVAGYYTAGVDADDIYARMSPEHKLAASMLLDRMQRWDDDLQIKSVDMSASPFIGEGFGRDGAIDIYS